MKTLFLVVLFLAFTIPSTVLVLDTGYFAFIHLARREPWALQMLVDLFIACSVFIGWMWKDAAARRLRAWPYALMILTLGSIGVLAYLIRRRIGASSTVVA